MFRAIAIITILFAISMSAFAQENLVGKWRGSYEFKGLRGDERFGLDLEIISVENNIVKGIANNNSRGGCRGEHSMIGKLDGNKLGMISDKPGGPAGDCKFGFRVTVDGDKMTGTIGASELKLSKR